MKEKFVGIDASLTCTGLSLYENDKFKFDRVKSNPKDFSNDLERLQFIVNKIYDFIPKDVNLICLEDVYVSKFQTGSSMKLIGLAYLLRMKLYESKFPLYIVSPNQLKKHILQKGNGDKKLILREVFKRYGQEVADDNIADALVLSKIAHEVYCLMEGLTIESTLPQKQTISSISYERPNYNTKWKKDPIIEEDED